MCRSTLIRCLGLIALLLAAPAVADDPAASAPALAAAPALALDGGACPDVPANVTDSGAAPAIGEGDVQPMIGCTASYNCVHGTIVSCSSPVNNTCSASGGNCGSVTCGGQTTWCPGACAGDHHCARFCDWAPNSYCDWAGCCVCQD
jgi:hypothetical protein